MLNNNDDAIETNTLDKQKLFRELEYELKNYPNNITQIKSIRKIAENLGLARNSVNRWIKKYLNRKFGHNKALEIFNKIWSSKSRPYNTITFEDVKSYIKDKGGEIITEKEYFNAMDGPPTLKYIIVKCNMNHSWKIRINDILYNNRWCPHCQQRLCEGVTRLYMEKIFNNKFPEITLNRALGTPGHKGGGLKFDGYNNSVKVNNKIFKIAFEYDGIQHDNFPNQVHGDNIKRFLLQQARDNMKLRIALDNNVILIKIKEVNGFDRYHLDLIQYEIIKQFEQATSISLYMIDEFKYDPSSNTLKKR